MQRVVKIGGSLAKNGQLKTCLIALEQRYQGNMIIVPGGGAFADTVREAQRQWGFDDRTAHEMAILAMQQMALLIKALQPEWLVVSSAEQLVPDAERNFIWKPQIAELDRAQIPASWQVTSDSLAAWLAGLVSADELVLLKSTSIQPGADLAVLQHQGIIDAAFRDYLRPECQLSIVYYQDVLADSLKWKCTQK